MAFNYKPDDMVYDIESLDNVFTNAQWFPNKDHNELIISYLDDSNLIKSEADKDLIRQQILTINPKLKRANTKITFENLKEINNFQRFAQRFGVASIETFNNFYKSPTQLNIRTQGQGAALHSPYQNPYHQPFENYQVGDYFEGTDPEKLKNGNMVKWYNLIANQDERVFNAHKQLKTLPPLIHTDYYPVKQSDEGIYNENKHGLRLGFNSTNYDLTLMALVFAEIPRQLFGWSPDQVKANPNILKEKVPLELDAFNDGFNAKEVRRINNILFNDENKGAMRNALRNQAVTGIIQSRNGKARLVEKYKANGQAFYIHKAWLQTNRFIDISALNAKGKMSLKRLSAYKSLQVKESDKLSGNETKLKSIEEFADLLAYNISDVVNTKVLFEDPAYQDTFFLHEDLLEDFPELTYDRQFPKNYYQGNDRDDANTGFRAIDNLKYSRLTTDTTSAKFVTMVIAPYAPLEDDKVLDYMYPDADILKEINESGDYNVNGKPLHTKPFDVLENTKQWIERMDKKYFANHPNKAGSTTPIWDEFKDAYAMYDDIRGKNFNDTLKDKYGNDAESHSISKIMNDYDSTVFYIGPDGEKTASMAKFSVGGIHGAEINQVKYDQDMADWQALKDEQRLMQDYYEYDASDPDKSATLAHHDKELEINGVVHEPRKSLKSGGTNKLSQWKDLEKSKPTIFGSDGKVRKKYAYVSIDPANHEDFSSFYPLLLSRLAVFRDITGNDRYYELYKERLKLKAQLKTLEKNTPEYDEANMNQLTRKLLLNSASGQGDAKFPSNIRKNNATIAMRIIGQLFAWRIGQAEALAGARVPSTNTDGLYTMSISPEENNRVLEETVNEMMIDIEPELVTRFVSKDSNNRIEIGLDKKGQEKIDEAKGGDLTAWRGPGVSNNLAHPAIIDNVLAKYLGFSESASNEDFNRDKARHILTSKLNELLSADEETRISALAMFQWIIVSGLASNRYPFATFTKYNPELERFEHYSPELDKLDSECMLDGEHISLPIKAYTEKLSHTNRVFLLKPNLNGGINRTLRLVAKDKVKANSKTGQDLNNPEAKDADLLLRTYYQYDVREETAGLYNPVFKKVTDLDENQPVGILNQDLHDLKPQHIKYLVENLDIEAYLDIIENKFNKNWRNAE